MSAVIVNVSRGRKLTPSIAEETLVVKRVRRQLLGAAVSRIDGQKVKRSNMAKNQQGKKRKGKVPDGKASKEPSSTIRRTRSKTLAISKQNYSGSTGSPSVGKGKHMGTENRKRSRETGAAVGGSIPRRISTRIRNRFLPHLAKITEEACGLDDECSKSLQEGQGVVQASKSRGGKGVRVSPRAAGIALKRSTFTQRKGVQKKVKESKNASKRGAGSAAAAKKPSTAIMNVARSKKTLLQETGLQELREPSKRSADAPRQRSNCLPAVEQNSDVAAADGKGQKGLVVDNMARVTTSKGTTNALRIAEEATGFVRSAMNAVVEARLREEQARKSVDVSVAETGLKGEQNQSNGSSRSTRSRTSLIAETLIQELDTFGLASKGDGSDLKDKMRKGINQLTRTSKQNVTSLKKATKLPRVANQDALPKVKESALVRRVKSDIEDHVKRYGLLEQERQGRFSRKIQMKVSGLEQQSSEAEDDSESPSTVTVAPANDWTPEQEMALQDAYVSIKPAADFWYHISKQVPGRTAGECFNKFYSGHPTPPAAQRPKREYGNTLGEPDALPNVKKGKLLGPKQRLIEAHRTIRNILRKQQVDDEEYEADAFVALERADVVESVLDRKEADEAVIFKATKVLTCTAPMPGSKPPTKRFDDIVISGLSSGIRTPNKENRSMNGLVLGKVRVVPDSQTQLCSPEVLKKVKDPGQLDKYIDHLHQRHARRPRTTGNQRGAKKSNVYLHSKDALDFGDNTLSAIQRAKEELRNVFLKSGAASGPNFLDIVGNPEEEEEEDLEEDEHDDYFSDC